MSDKELEIFELCEKLTELLGDKEAIADLKKLYDKHPEMFQNMQEVSNTIREVVSKPEIITSAKRDGGILAVKQLDNKKVGEVAIENDKGTNIIFHTNKKNISKMNYLKKNGQMSVETPSAKAAPTWLDRCADKSNDLSRDSKVLSTSANNIIPQSKDSLENKTNLTKVSESAIAKMKQKIDEMAKKGFSFSTKAKQQSINKGKDR